MRRGVIGLGLTIVLGCRGENPPSREPPPPGERTSSPYSTGSDSGAARQQLEGTNRGVEFEAPRRIPAVVAALSQLTSAGKTPDKTDLAALRGDIGTLEDAMRDDFARVGLADTGAFHDLTDSIARQLGGGPGGLTKDIDPKEVPELSTRVERLIGIYHDWMRRTQK